MLGINTRLRSLRPSQYSSGSKIQVDERSASVITQSLSPALVLGRLETQPEISVQMEVAVVRTALAAKA